MADDLSSAQPAPRGVDLVAAAAGGFIRGRSTPATATITATGVTAGVEVAGQAALRLDLVVSAASGTSPSDTITIQTSFDNGATDAWRTVAAFPAVTAAGTTRQVFTGLDRWVRASHVVTGTTPSLTYSLSGEGV
ncbi:hypothetical protein K6U06_06600 [Acidiferrimicrobium sp. IK]|uniref:hypothetical protein n=1 Tax=Acidiferrimicrobium sp. IK TaxID=2871700 RepID=UPI0021CB954E|nr:hypothetical protein [Acidiferrimicrobium sp. IK]MCU4184023.1 hypothetical protein [Acidiferrimicrobium sp. IK]